MPPLSRSVLLALICGLLFLAPPASLSAHHLTGQKGPGTFQEGASGWELPTGAGPPGHRMGARLRPSGDEVLLAKAASTSKKKG